MEDQLSWTKRLYKYAIHPSDVQNKDHQTYVKTELGDSEKYHKVLEINWDTNTDCCIIEFDSLVKILIMKQLPRRKF